MKSALDVQTEISRYDLRGKYQYLFLDPLYEFLNNLKEVITISLVCTAKNG